MYLDWGVQGLGFRAVSFWRAMRCSPSRLSEVALVTSESASEFVRSHTSCACL